MTKKDGEYILRDLRGHDKWKLFSNIAAKDDKFMESIFVDIPQIKKVNKVNIFG